VKRAVIVVCDGLRADLVTPGLTPNLVRLAKGGRVFASHSSVFPSTTRVTSASIATGCRPGRHGLEGNAVALDEGAGLFPISAGLPDFRDRMLKARGATLLVPTLAQRLADHGGSVVFSNVSAGAAQFQDPDGFGHVYHRQGSYGPGRVAVDGGDHLDVTHDGAGDAAMTERFRDEVLGRRRPALAVLWLCEPDHTQHGNPMGSPAHVAAIAGADACAARVAETVDGLAAGGDDILLFFCSDHGHETVDSVIPLDDILIQSGFKAGAGSSDVVVASNGLSAGIYVADGARGRIPDIAAFLRTQDWVGEVFAGAELVEAGLRDGTPLAISVTTAKSGNPNAHGIPGLSPAIADSLPGESRIGCGQHGGLGEFEQSPFLFVRGGGFAPGTRSEATTAPTDIAPTILRHLGLPAEGMDGRPLAQQPDQ
jgi:predicted AlkP superfamily pyrophosphatase or phosphodiesterase